MQSKTFYSKAICRQNLKSFWPIGFFYLLYLVSFGPGFIFLECRNGGADQISCLQNLFSEFCSPVIIMLMALPAVMACFSCLYNRTAAYMMHSFPVTRKELYASGLISAMALLFVPQLLVSLLMAVQLLLPGLGSCLNLVAHYLVFSFLWDLFFIGFAAFTSMFTGQLWPCPIFYLIWNFAADAALVLLSGLMALVSFTDDSVINFQYDNVLTPVVYLFNFTGIAGSDDLAKAPGPFGYPIALAYAACGLLLMTAGFFIYKRRKIEATGSFITVAAARPLFRWGIGLFAGLGFALSLFEIFLGLNSANYIAFLIVLILASLFSFLLSCMLIEKNYRIFTTRRLIEAFACAFALCLCTFAARSFSRNLAVQIPDKDDLKTVSLYSANITLADDKGGPQTDRILEINRYFSEHFDEIRQTKATDGDITWIQIRYQTKNGRVYTKSYSLPDCEDPANPCSVLLAMVNETLTDPENIKTAWFSDDYTGLILTSAYVSKISETGESSYDYLDGSRYEALKQAIFRDIDEGHLIPVPDADSEILYNLDLEYSLPQNDLTGEEIAGDFKTDTSYLSLYITADCTNILQIIN